MALALATPLAGGAPRPQTASTFCEHVFAPRRVFPCSLTRRLRTTFEPRDTGNISDSPVHARLRRWASHVRGLSYVGSRPANTPISICERAFAPHYIVGKRGSPCPNMWRTWLPRSLIEAARRVSLDGDSPGCRVTTEPFSPPGSRGPSDNKKHPSIPAAGSGCFLLSRRKIERRLSSDPSMISPLGTT